jgi:hypothetical protein
MSTSRGIPGLCNFVVVTDIVSPRKEFVRSGEAQLQLLRASRREVSNPPWALQDASEAIRAACHLLAICPAGRHAGVPGIPFLAGAYEHFVER